VLLYCIALHYKMQYETIKGTEMQTDTHIVFGAANKTTAEDRDNTPGIKPAVPDIFDMSSMHGFCLAAVRLLVDPLQYYV